MKHTNTHREMLYHMTRVMMSTSNPEGLTKYTQISFIIEGNKEIPVHTSHLLYAEIFVMF